MKKIPMVAVLAFVSVCAVPAITYASSGDGTPGNPYQITTCTELQDMQNNPSSSYVLANDIDCSATVSWNGGAGFVPILAPGGFSGTLDGQGHIITGLYENSPFQAEGINSYNYVGLFSVLGVGSVVKNVGLENVNIIAPSGGAVAGLVGENMGDVSTSYVTGSVHGLFIVGGLVGENFGTVSNSYATASVHVTTDHGGGFIGANRAGAVITDSYSAGSVTGGSALGGFSAYNVGTITDSYWDTQTSGQSASQGGTGKTTAEMMQQSTFGGWDFSTIWGIHEGTSYPYLRWLFDTTAPTASPSQSPAANGNGWNNGDVSVTWDWTDNAGGSGIDAANCTTSSVSSGEGTITLSATCKDLAGNIGSATYTVKVDKTNPTVTYTGNLGTYGLLAPVNIACTPADSLSGVASNTCVNASGSAWSFGAGPHTLTATATDMAGNIGTGSATFTVTVKSADLCTLTGQFVNGSVKYQALKPAAQKGVNALVKAGCTILTSNNPKLSPTQRAALIKAYKQSVQALVAPGWLTQAQANVLIGLVSAL